MAKNRLQHLVVQRGQHVGQQQAAAETEHGQGRMQVDVQGRAPRGEVPDERSVGKFVGQVHDNKAPIAATGNGGTQPGYA